MTNQAVKAAQEAVQKSEDLDIRLILVFFSLFLVETNIQLIVWAFMRCIYTFRCYGY